jgi:hypothetical protein
MFHAILSGNGGRSWPAAFCGRRRDARNKRVGVDTVIYAEA